MSHVYIQCMNCGETYNDIHDLMFLGYDENKEKVGHCPNCGVSSNTQMTVLKEK